MTGLRVVPGAGALIRDGDAVALVLGTVTPTLVTDIQSILDADEPRLTLRRAAARIADTDGQAGAVALIDHEADHIEIFALGDVEIQTTAQTISAGDALVGVAHSGKLSDIVSIGAMGTGSATPGWQTLQSGAVAGAGLKFMEDDAAPDAAEPPAEASSSLPPPAPAPPAPTPPEPAPAPAEAEPVVEDLPTSETPSVPDDARNSLSGWTTPDTPPPPAPAPPPPPPPEPAPAAEPPAADSPAPPPPPAPPQQVPVPGSGQPAAPGEFHVVSLTGGDADIQREPVPVGDDSAAPPPADMPPYAQPVKVYGVLSPNGHFNHPEARYCSRTGVKMGASHTRQLIQGDRPPLGVITFSDGTTYSIEHNTVIGRAPEGHPSVMDGTAAALCIVDDGRRISRQHLLMELVDWDVYVTDLETANGTWFRNAPTEEARRLGRSERVQLNSGGEVGMGDLTFIYHEHHVR